MSETRITDELSLDAWLMAATAVTEAPRDEAAAAIVEWIRTGSGLPSSPEVRYRCCDIATKTRTGSMTLEGFLGRARHLEGLYVADQESDTPSRSPAGLSGAPVLARKKGRPRRAKT